MKTFYDFRDVDSSNPNKSPLEGRVIFKNPRFWLCWIKNANPLSDTSIKGFVVAPRTIYLYNVYIAKSLWDAFKYYIKVSYLSKDKY